MAQVFKKLNKNVVFIDEVNVIELALTIPYMLLNVLSSGRFLNTLIIGALLPGT